MTIQSEYGPLDRVDFIEPRAGWTLWTGEEVDIDGFARPFYVAVSGSGETRFLDVSRFDFTPTQARFDWLVDNGFPGRSAFGLITPIRGRHIDAELASAGRVAA